MRKMSFWRWLVLVGLLLLLVVLLWVILRRPTYKLEPGQSFFEGFVILTGTEKDIETVVANFRELKRVRGASVELASVPSPPATPTDTPSPPATPTDTPATPATPATPTDTPATPTDTQPSTNPETLTAEHPEPEVPVVQHPSRSEMIVARLYSISEGVSVEEIIPEIYGTVLALWEEGSLRYPVFADPNYVTGYLPLQGNPWSIAGDPFGVPAPTSGGDAGDLFDNQWAFGEQGIALPKITGKAQSPVVRIAVFDTSPFTQGKGFGTKKIDWVTPTWDLSVSHPFAISIKIPSNITPEPKDVRDHGLFVASLVHAVAPQGEISLIRVLNEYGVGNLYDLIKGLKSFVDQASALDNTVINLSLGVHPDKYYENLPGLASSICELLKQISYESDQCSDTPVATLEILMQALYKRGAVIVAAAGNDSSENPPGQPEPSQIPAIYPDVIGVAASNMEGKLSCFSNTSDVAAPGGEGGPEGGKPCQPKLDACSTQTPCPYGVIGVVLKRDMFPTGYAYWAGTSFAAPLVSGQAALLFQNQLDSAQVYSRIKETARKVGGVPIINISSSLESPVSSP